MPVENAPTWRRAASASPTSASRRAIASASGAPCRRRAGRSPGSPRRSGRRRTRDPGPPTRRRAAARRPEISTPSRRTRTEPESGRRSAARIFRNVVLPLPFGPETATSPRRRAKARAREIRGVRRRTSRGPSPRARLSSFRAAVYRGGRIPRAGCPILKGRGSLLYDPRVLDDPFTSRRRSNRFDADRAGRFRRKRTTLRRGLMLKRCSASASGSRVRPDARPPAAARTRTPRRTRIRRRSRNPRRLRRPPARLRGGAGGGRRDDHRQGDLRRRGRPRRN